MVKVQLWCHDRFGAEIPGLDPRPKLFARMPVVGDHLLAEVDDERVFVVRNVFLWPLDAENQVAGEVDAYLVDEP